MRISCPNCTAKYELDERLLPASGAPVQCTSCNHVFLAVPGSGTSVAAEKGVPSEAAESPASRTMRFGQEQAAAPAGRTGIYGTVSRRPQPGAPTPVGDHTPAADGSAASSAGQDPHQTTRFGAATPGGEPARHRTVVFGASAAGTVSPQSYRQTAIFGARAGLAGEAQQHTADAATEPPHHTTAFGATPAPPVVGGAAPRTSTPPFGSPMFGAQEPQFDDEDDEDEPLELAPIPFTPPTASPPRVPGRSLSGSSLPLGGAPSLFSPEPRRAEPSPSDGFKIYDEPQRKLSIDLRRIAIVAGILLSLAGIAFFAKQIIARAHAIPRALIDQEQGAMTMLRRDDATTRQSVADELERLATRAPRFVAARADHALTLALELDDLQAPLVALSAEGRQLDGRIAQLSAAKTPSDWAVRVNVLRDQQAKLRAESDRIHTEATGRKHALDRALRGLPTATEESTAGNLAVIRARALAAGVEGNGTALELAERYRKLGDPGGWAQVVLAEYTLNANAPPETVEEVKTGLRQLKSADPWFLRPYVLLARMDLLDDHRADAASELEAAVALVPEHTVAKRLLSHLSDLPADPESH